VGDHNLFFFALNALMRYQVAVFSRHFQAINHHQRPYFNMKAASSHSQQVLHVSVFEIQLAVEFIVFFVEGAARNKDPDSHDRAFWKMKLMNQTLTAVSV